MIFKNDLVKKRAALLHPKALEILQDMDNFCLVHRQVFEVTDAVTTAKEDNALNPPRKSSTHRTARAFDVSVHGWDAGFIKLFIECFNQKYQSTAAISPDTFKPELVVDETKSVDRAPHLHVQIHRRFAIYDPFNQGPLNPAS